MPHLSELAPALRRRRQEVHGDMGLVVRDVSEAVAAQARQNATEGGEHTRRTRTPAERPGGPAKITGKGSDSLQAKQFPPTRYGIWRARVTYNRDGFYMPYVEKTGYKFFGPAKAKTPEFVQREMRRRFPGG